MKIDKYKNIEEVLNNKNSYLTTEVDEKELTLIDKGFIPTSFNIGNNDVIEFLLYDVNNNLLDQSDIGEVRYIRGEQIKEYLIKSDNKEDIQFEGGGWLVDVKKLIKEAGFNSGIFNIQINFLNDRVGSAYPKNKLWIQEISPSRTEVRLLPYNNFNNNNLVEQDIKKDLNQSYDSFVKGKFNGDEVYNEIIQILNKLDSTQLSNSLNFLKDENYISQIKSEFGIKNLESFYSLVLEDMKKAVQNELLYKNSIIGDINFGKPYSTLDRSKISGKDFSYYNKSDIVNLLNQKFKESIEYHLPKRKLNNQIYIDQKTFDSLQELDKVVQTLTSTSIYGIESVEKIVYKKELKTELPITIDSPKDEIKDDIKIIDDIVSPQLEFGIGPIVNIIDEDSVSIVWGTTLPTKGVVRFLNNICPSNICEWSYPTFTKKHSLIIDGLEKGKTYIFEIIAKSENEKEIVSQQTTISFLINSESNTTITEPDVRVARPVPATEQNIVESNTVSNTISGGAPINLPYTNKNRNIK